jgi:hypothetical protein
LFARVLRPSPRPKTISGSARLLTDIPRTHLARTQAKKKEKVPKPIISIFNRPRTTKGSYKAFVPDVTVGGDDEDFTSAEGDPSNWSKEKKALMRHKLAAVLAECE